MTDSDDGWNEKSYRVPLVKELACFPFFTPVPFFVRSAFEKSLRAISGISLSLVRGLGRRVCDPCTIVYASLLNSRVPFFFFPLPSSFGPFSCS